MKAVLTFHSVDDSGSVISFPKAAFASLIEAVSNSDVPCCDLDTLLAPETRRGIALTFDDGMESVYTNALPVMKRYGVPGHLFLTTGVVGKSNRWPGNPPLAPEFRMMDWAQIEACHKGGLAIESHTRLHPDLRNLNPRELLDECETADSLIEQELGRRPRYFAYPYGYHDDKTRNFVKTRYQAAFTTELRYLNGREDSAALPRLDSYYLKTAFFHGRLGSPLTRGYLNLRGFLRRLRGTE